MNVIHRITFRDGEPAEKVFAKAGFKIKDGMNTLDVGENHADWETIKEAIAKYGIYGFQYRTEFTKKEMEAAQFYALIGEWNFEYPQPSDAFGYKEITYKPGIGCRKCGVGLEQQKPFSIKKGPTWGKRNILQLNWVFGEYFASNELKEKLNGKIPGVRFLEVLKYPKGTVLDDIFQLVVEKEVPLAIPENAKIEACDSCDNKKYLPELLARGFFPLPVETNFSIAKSKQYLGSGGQAYQVTVVSKATYQLLVEVGINGVNFIPCG